MSFNNNWSNDLIQFFKREGTVENPFVDIEQTLKIQYDRIFLQEVPDEFSRVVVKDAEIILDEVNRKEDILAVNDYFVDYEEGSVHFHSDAIGKTLVFTYKGTGALLYPASRIYTGTFATSKETLQDALDNALLTSGQANEALADVQAKLAEAHAEIIAMQNARQEAEEAIANVSGVIQNANDKAILADEKAQLADEKATLAQTSATNANNKITEMNTKISEANTKITETETARQNAITATNNANTLIASADSIINDFTHKGAYNSATAYKPRNIVSYNGSSYMNIVASTNIAPTDTSKWLLMSSKGDQGIQGIKGDKGDKGDTGTSFIWKGEYATGTAYIKNDVVGYNGSTYIAKQNTIGNLPTNITFWDVFTQKGADGIGAVDSVNGKSGDVTLNAEEVGAIPASEKGVAGGVAKINAQGKVIDADGNEVEGKVRSVNGETGDVTITSVDSATNATNATSADDAKKLGGQLPANYATAKSVTDVDKKVGDTTKLTTTNKTDVVSAVNENVDKIVVLSNKLEQADRQSQVIQHGVSVLNGEVGSPVDLEISGRTLVNLLGNDGNCEDVNKWSKALNGGTLTLESTEKKYGNYSFKFDYGAATNTLAVYKQIPQLTVTGKYFLLLADVKTSTANKTRLRLGDLYSSYHNGDGSWKTLYVKSQNVLSGKDYAYLYSESGIAYIDGVRVYEVDQATYDKIGVSLTDADVEKMFPYVDGVQHLTNPAVIAEGTNLINSHSLEKGDINASTGVDMSSVAHIRVNEFIPVMDTVPYSLSPRSASTDQRYYAYDANKKFISSSYMNENTIFPNGTRFVKVRWVNTYGNGSVEDLVKLAQLEVGEKVTPYQARNPSYLFADVKLGQIGDKKDVLSKQDGKWFLTKNVEKDVVLDGSLNWTFHADFTGFKRFRTVFPNLTYISDNKCQKYDGKILKWVSPSNPDEFLTETNGNFTITISDTDSGWTEAMTPSSDLIKSYFYGWKYTGDGTNHSWKSIVDGTLPPTNTLAYVSKNMATGYTPYKLSYVLAKPEVINVSDKVEGDIVINGLTQVEVNSGVIVREKVVPIHDVGNKVYRVAHLGYAPLKHKNKEIVSVYKNAEKDSLWEKWTGGTGNFEAYGVYRLVLPEKSYDPTADYHVTYLVLDRHQFTSNATEVKTTYARNIRSVLDDVVVKQSDIETHQDVQDFALDYIEAKADNNRIDLDQHKADTEIHITKTERDKWNKTLDDAKEYADAVVSTNLTEIGHYEYSVKATTDNQTVFTIPLDTYDSITDKINFFVRRIPLRKDDVSIAGRTVTLLNDSVELNDFLYMEIIKNIKKIEQETLSGIYIEDGTLSKQKLDASVQSSLDKADSAIQSSQKDINGGVAGLNQSGRVADSEKLGGQSPSYYATKSDADKALSDAKTYADSIVDDAVNETQVKIDNIGKRFISISTGVYDELDISNVDFVYVNTADSGVVQINNLIVDRAKTVRFVKINFAGSLVFKYNSSLGMYTTSRQDVVVTTPYGYVDVVSSSGVGTTTKYINRFPPATIISPNDPSGGADGDIWFKFKE